MLVNAKRESRYETFGLLKEATKLKLIEDSQDGLVYHKMIQTGELDFPDYGAGFLNFEISALPCAHNRGTFPLAVDGEWYVRIWIATIDDGDMGAWSKPNTKTHCRNLAHQIAHDVMAGMVKFPTLEKLNEQLRRFGLCVGRE